MKFREIKQKLEAAGWREKPGGKSSHRHFVNPDTGVKVTVPCHPGDVNPFTLANIQKITGVRVD